jgi:transposase
LRGQELASPPDGVRRDPLLERLAALAPQPRRVERELARVGQAQPGVVLLTTIPGVGIRTAEAVVAYLDDLRRFGSAKQVASYLGLVPCQDASGGTNRLGHITRQGPGLVRRLLTEAAWQGVRRSATLRARSERLCRGDPERKKIALVATAHYVVRVMAALLRTGTGWREAAAAAGSRGAAVAWHPGALPRRDGGGNQRPDPDSRMAVRGRNVAWGRFALHHLARPAGDAE